MCLIVLALNQSTRYPLVMVANRDELHERPTAAADYWPQHPGVVGGRDLLRGGTWLAVDERGRLGAVTNFRDPVPQDRPASRGELVTDFLASQESSETFAQALGERQDRYAGFNLVVGQFERSFQYLSNRDQPRSLGTGVYGISNGMLDNDWPKVARTKAAVQRWLRQGGDDRGGLFDILADRQVTANAGADEWARALTATFIVNPSYGTRASACLLFGADGRAVFEERRFDAAGASTGSSVFEFALKR